MLSIGCRSNIYKCSLSFVGVVSFFLSHGKDISLLAVCGKTHSVFNVCVEFETNFSDKQTYRSVGQLIIY